MKNIIEKFRTRYYFVTYIFKTKEHTGNGNLKVLNKEGFFNFTAIKDYILTTNNDKGLGFLELTITGFIRISKKEYLS
jgi:hypothetical protein